MQSKIYILSFQRLPQERTKLIGASGKRQIDIGPFFNGRFLPQLREG
jgi:hypothetical protein